MSLTEKIGFFQDYYLNIKNNCTDDEIKKFANLKTDEERFDYVSNLNAIQDDVSIQIKKECSSKSEKDAIEFKEKGNQAFKNKKWTEAMVLYSKGYIATPHEKCSDAAIILANRSAALLHMERYDETLEDIKHAIARNYPKDLLYKLYERQAKCYLAKKEYVDAIEAFKKTITALDDCKLPFERKSKIERDSMIMIQMLESDLKMKKEKTIKKTTEKLNEDDKEFVSNAVTIDNSPEQGRFAKSTKNIDIGDEILIEKPNTFALLEKYCKTHCQHCFKRTITPLACSYCTNVIFCSEQCLKDATESYHKHECGILSTLWRSGASINCHLALRIVSNKSVDYFLQIKNDLQKTLDFKELKKLEHNDYRRVYNLVRHEDKRQTSSFFQYAVMSHFLVSLLKESEYFGSNSTKEQINFIGGLILRNLQFLQFNTHEIFELHQSNSGAALKTVFIGAGVYSTLALFNHSCDPGIVKYYKGNTVYVNTIKPIKNGQIIAENYGPFYTQENRTERQTKLKDLYWFDCECEACINNWPCFDAMDNNLIRFRCDAEDKCNAVIEVPANCNDFMIKCNQCGQYTNILKGLKVMQDTVMIDKTAKRLYDAGDIQKALYKYIDMLKIMHEVLMPPFSDYCQCQQHIKDCFLHFGNSYVISE